MINVTDVAIMMSYLMAWMSTHNALAREMKDQNGVLKEVIQMETIEVVIRMPKDMYERTLCTGVVVVGVDAAYIGGAIIDGTVLPKGHGRLIDADAILEDPFGNTYKDIDIAETIIEADKEA